MSALTDRFDAVCERLEKALSRSGRDRENLELVAVSKTHGAASVAELCVHWQTTGKGRALFGESYTGEAGEKIARVERLLTGTPAAASMPQTRPPVWHFVGHVQSRKSREVIGQFELIHSLDSVRLAEALQKAWETKKSEALAKSAPPMPPQNVLVQVNVGREAQKHGIAPEGLEDLLNAARALPGIRVRGLMCLPPLAGTGEDSRPYFIMLRTLRDKMEKLCALPLPHLSMGMSGDFETAAEEGATLLRIGTDIFGTRDRT
ncbi:MAG: YggS family pyridoxal phosphate-dependent enzyme [Desulfovibrio sp.]|nr:YggS family pyridoxal phosphate-dependent enzyme [Desulfovibrio sp.]